ncbi:FAD-dependent monooxygenase [Streptomyces malaysiensis]|uniref:FAD-dependent monooxygenase n=1 Tax=Streptomyces malaysiensis TaxID=92644 RepID=UPI002B2A058C|nr:FAD-dependent monooxygenase [Streptomyces malaysiensis]
MVIVGAGIAGTTAAIALAETGWTVHILELSPDGRTAGWGLSLTGPALRALDSLGLADVCVDAGYGMSRITNWEPDGSAFEIGLPPLLGPNRPATAGIPRPELHRILTARALERGVAISYGLSVADLQELPSGVQAVLTDGRTVNADLIVGADGIRSQVRKLLGLDATLNYTGQGIWRARVPRPTWATGIHTFALDDRQMGVVPIGANEAYVFLTENGALREVVPDEELAVRMSTLMEPFEGRAAGLREPVLRSEGVVRRMGQTLVVDGEWHTGRVVLVGDAVHAPSPQTASGAALAIEDGVVLAEELTGHLAAEQALMAFGARRLKRCSTLVNTSLEVALMEQKGRHLESHALVEQCHRLLAQPA